MIKAVIFDMDGLIVDSEPVNSLSWEILLKKYGKQPIFNEQGLIHRVGFSGDAEYLEMIKKYNLVENIETIRKHRRQIFIGLLGKINLLPGAIDALKMFKKHSKRLALASNRNIQHILLISKNLGIKDFFDVIIGPRNKRKHKPAPDIYLDTAKALGVLPIDCLVLEDSEAGVLAAVGAGMKVIAVPSKYTKSHDFSNADKVVDSLVKITEPLLFSL